MLSLCCCLFVCFCLLGVLTLFVAFDRLFLLSVFVGVDLCFVVFCDDWLLLFCCWYRSCVCADVCVGLCSCFCLRLLRSCFACSFVV